METLPIGTKVQSTWTDRITGYIVGYGSLRWPENKDTNGDIDAQLVYLVQTERRFQIRDMSEGKLEGYIGCIVMNANRVREI